MTSHFKRHIASRQRGEAFKKEIIHGYEAYAQTSTLFQTLHIMTSLSNASDSSPRKLLAEW
jgi:hypothetical protein